MLGKNKIGMCLRLEGKYNIGGADRKKKDLVDKDDDEYVILWGKKVKIKWLKKE